MNSWSEEQRRALEDIYRRLDWSNQDALEDTLARLAGHQTTFLEWFAAHPE